jgi:Na+/melibiose symporter-like transporter
MFGVTFLHFTALALRGGALYAYYHHYADKAAMYDWLRGLDLISTSPSSQGGILETLGLVVHGDRARLATSNVADVFNSIVNMIGLGITILALLLSPVLSRTFGKKTVAVVGFALAGLATCGFTLLGPTQVGSMVALTAVVAIFYAPTISLIWAIYADVVDYLEWTTGRRLTGVVFATIGFALKCGLALGSAGFLWLMASFFKYDSGSADAPLAVEGFRWCNGLVVGISLATCALLLSTYKLNKQVTLQMVNELPNLRLRFAVDGKP